MGLAANNRGELSPAGVPRSNAVVREGYQMAAEARERLLMQQKPTELSMYVSELAARLQSRQARHATTRQRGPERTTSNIGQPDPYGHQTTKPVHPAQPSKRASIAAAANSTFGSIPTAGDTNTRRPNAVVPPSRILGAAGASSRPDGWLFHALR